MNLSLVEVWLPYGDTEVCTRIPTKNYLKIEKFKEEPPIKNSELVIKNCLVIKKNYLQR